MTAPEAEAPAPDDLTVPVELLERSYPIRILSGHEIGSRADEFATGLVTTLGDCTHAIVIADEAVRGGIADPLIAAVSRLENVRVTLLTVPSGETSKSAAQLADLWDAMCDASSDRRSVVIAVGGGVVGDLAGFAAATFTRGLRLVQVPTTLLSMVDSSVGGKTGINLAGGKNLVGAFWQPQWVWIDTANLTTLPEREFLSGLAEVIKYGVIEDADFFRWLESNITAVADRDPAALRTAIEQSCRCKARVVADDERETSGRRAILNYGHTFAHAIESTAGYGTFLHGEAVSIGMQMAARLAVLLGECSAELFEKQTRLLTAAKLPLRWPQADAEAMLPVMARDKKVAHGQLRFVLPTRIGHVHLVGDVDPAVVRQAIAEH